MEVDSDVGIGYFMFLEIPSVLLGTTGRTEVNAPEAMRMIDKGEFMRALYYFVCVLFIVMPIWGCGGGDSADQAADATENVAKAAENAGDNMADATGEAITTTADKMKQEMMDELSRLEADLKPLKETAMTLTQEDLDKHLQGIQVKVDEVRNSLMNMKLEETGDLEGQKKAFKAKLDDIGMEMKKAQSMIDDLKSKMPGH
ncbi:MAG: hypothetical protein KJ970_04840 [Candidatus Eisenbacteria bacterium]|uniref:Uncharacterized protein n=1 Tax=Eiseniibacteriota bacterium TaxID=2212470 RepID=A0A948W5B7_UNCEI|nr:hypothetical protein [Candidatus Eisenbacteria bacterium]MBU2690234.1 hypothetical protein [Candidatus Eisenbacteria bacterium]